MEYHVYVKVKDGHITAVDSSAFLADAAGWVQIDSGSGDRFHHAQGNYFPESLMTDSGAYRYKLADGKAVRCTQEEIAAQEAAAGPTAPRNILTGEYVTVNGVLYKATANIPVGEAIVTGQNAVETTIEEQLAELAKGE